MHYCFFNPHPQNKIVNDCVKRAITKASGRDYKEIALCLNRYKKVTGAPKFNSKENAVRYIEKEMQGIRMTFPVKAGQPRMNGERFCKRYPKGTYILQMPKHVVCVKDGIIYDTWDCSLKCVYGAWKIPEKNHKIS